MTSRKKHRAEVNLSRHHLLETRGDLCEWCHQRIWTDLHHCIIHRMKDIQELDSENNLMCVCHSCHISGIVDTLDAKIIFWNIQILRGCDMYQWLESVPLKIKPILVRYEWPNNLDSHVQSLLLEAPLAFLAPMIQSEFDWSSMKKLSKISSL